ncbi:Hypothetical predicted protein [Olea europaea subsp. europaea]|uniref:Uncharacterized protein n=1 Tax=Olea europaea subsp. europaea TaxID=158383 RepID=A0A8S0SB46_OLEEU|nr:Hypothetical predicted protein [Olea europaea subsp. europaea]
MNGVQYNKPIQSTFSTESQRKTKHMTERSFEDVVIHFCHAFKVLRVQVSEFQVDNKLLKVELEDIKLHMSSLNEGKTNKMDDIVQMQACIKSDLMDIQMNMLFLFESVSTMISSAMDEIIRWSDDRISERGVGQTEAPGVGDQEHHGAGGSDKA